MSRKKLALVHTSTSLVPMFNELVQRYLPQVDHFHVADDSLIKNVIRDGALRPETARRVLDLIVSAESGGAQMVLATCSSIGRAVEASQAFVGIPVLRVDLPMADRAIAMGKNIGVIATVPTTLGPTQDLIQRRGELAGAEFQLTTRLCAGAFELLMAGDVAAHDQRVLGALQELMEVVDVIVLAQASMSRVASQLPRDVACIPILASPTIAMEYLANSWLQDDA
ncbi:MAG: hypothetical protein KDB03_18085 [Planctomycetales bacterium]|nr:hypothetical protein [Planctomycetales bacterium]